MLNRTSRSNNALASPPVNTTVSHNIISDMSVLTVTNSAMIKSSTFHEQVSSPSSFMPSTSGMVSHYANVAVPSSSPNTTTDYRLAHLTNYTFGPSGYSHPAHLTDSVISLFDSISSRQKDEDLNCDKSSFSQRKRTKISTPSLLETLGNFMDTEQWVTVCATRHSDNNTNRLDVKDMLPYEEAVIFAFNHWLMSAENATYTINSSMITELLTSVAQKMAYAKITTNKLLDVARHTHPEWFNPSSLDSSDVTETTPADNHTMTGKETGRQALLEKAVKFSRAQSRIFQDILRLVHNNRETGYHLADLLLHCNTRIHNQDEFIIEQSKRLAELDIITSNGDSINPRYFPNKNMTKLFLNTLRNKIRDHKIAPDSLLSQRKSH